MGFVDEKHCNTKTVRLGSGGRLTIDCSNIFTMTPEDRAFVLGILKALEKYEGENQSPAEDHHQ